MGWGLRWRWEGRWKLGGRQRWGRDRDREEMKIRGKTEIGGKEKGLGGGGGVIWRCGGRLRGRKSGWSLAEIDKCLQSKI